MINGYFSAIARGIVLAEGASGGDAMSRTTTHAIADRALGSTPADREILEQPTRPLPRLVLADLVRHLDDANARSESAQAEDATVTVSAEENRKLLEHVFAMEEAPTQPVERPSHDDEPTLAASSPASATRMTARPPPLSMIVLTKPAPSRAPVTPAAIISPEVVPPSTPRVAPALFMPAEVPVVSLAFVPSPVSESRPRITAELAKRPREQSAVEGRQPIATFFLRLPKPGPQTYFVAGIWAMALSLFLVLMLMATSA